MKDLKKMRDEFEHKLQLAAKENELEEKIGCEFFVFDRIFGPGFRACAKGKFEDGSVVSMTVAKSMLQQWPATEEQPLNKTATNDGTVFGLYHVTVSRGYRDAFTTMKVSWIFCDDEYEFTLRIDGNELLEPFFHSDGRKLSNSEFETYRPTRSGRLTHDITVPILSFMCEHISYAGGHESAIDLDEIENIIQTILNS